MPAAVGPRSLTNLQALLHGEGAAPRGTARPAHLLLTLQVADVTARVSSASCHVCHRRA